MIVQSFIVISVCFTLKNHPKFFKKRKKKPYLTCFKPISLLHFQNSKPGFWLPNLSLVKKLVLNRYKFSSYIAITNYVNTYFFYRFGLEYFVKLNAARNKNEDDPSDDESMLSDEEIRRNGINMQGNFSVKLHILYVI